MQFKLSANTDFVILTTMIMVHDTMYDVFTYCKMFKKQQNFNVCHIFYCSINNMF